MMKKILSRMIIVCLTCSLLSLTAAASEDSQQEDFIPLSQKRLMQVNEQSAQGKITHELFYDENGLLISATRKVDGYESTYTYSYDEEGHVTEINYPTGGGCCKYTYNESGQLIENEIPYGSAYYEYDDQGRLSVSTKKYETDTCITKHYYDENGLNIADEETRTNTATETTKILMHYYSFDSQNRLIEEIVTADGEEEQRIRYDYSYAPYIMQIVYSAGGNIIIQAKIQDDFGNKLYSWTPSVGSPVNIAIYPGKGQTDTDGQNPNILDKEIVAPRGFTLEGIERIKGKQGVYIVQSNKTLLYGLYDANGNILIPVEYDEMEFADDSAEETIILLKAEGKWGAYDKNGQEIFPIKYSEIQFKFDLGYAVVLLKDNGKWGVYDRDGKEIIPLEYDEIILNDNYFLAEKDEKQMLIRADGEIEKELKDRIYSKNIGKNYLSRFENLSNKYYDINEKLIEKVKIEYDIKHDKYYIYDYSDYSDIKNIKYQILDKDGKIIYEVENDIGYEVYKFISLNNRYIFIRDHSNSGGYLYDTIKQQKIDTRYRNYHRIDEDKVMVERADGWDIYDSEGNVCQTLELSGYDYIDIGSSMMVARYGKTYRVYDKNGQAITDQRYLDYDFLEEYVMIENLNGEWGVIDENGNEIIAFGDIEEESYKGKKIQKIDVVDGRLYILTNSSYAGFTLHVV